MEIFCSWHTMKLHCRTSSGKKIIQTHSHLTICIIALVRSCGFLFTFLFQPFGIGGEKTYKFSEENIADFSEVENWLIDP